jgi:phosphoserine aminotransferase
MTLAADLMRYILHTYSIYKLTDQKGVLFFLWCKAIAAAGGLRRKEKNGIAAAQLLSRYIDEGRATIKQSEHVEQQSRHSNTLAERENLKNLQGQQQQQFSLLQKKKKAHALTLPPVTFMSPV